MGNMVSCSCSEQWWGAAAGGPSTALVLDAEGERVGTVALPATAADVMREAPPEMVVAPAGEVSRTQRGVGLPPDRQLSAGELYLLLPAASLGSRLSDERMESVAAAMRAADRRTKRIRRGVVSPEKMEAADEEEAVGGVGGGRKKGFVERKVGRRGGRRRVGQCHRWRPALHTIDESSDFSVVTLRAQPAMGNLLACSSPVAGFSSSGGIVVFMPDGGVRRLKTPVAAAELMLEHPGHFVAELVGGARPVALPADYELEKRTLYAVVPMAGGKAAMARSRSLPAAGRVDGSPAAEGMEFGWPPELALQRQYSSKGWKPSLGTIEERCMVKKVPHWLL
ncbi:hypothetical protein AXF42_Ash012806 [Apostasia shenzhenica]|uniref:Uncharacterized protein n=1 Tax=Apostasia shenzhenica TaxID=1088818 RepID=A0A2I0AMI1_9ASPA|nr:hypothetical protein AXF42_Ash012806 [Apostasia shenzhenica]